MPAASANHENPKIIEQYNSIPHTSLDTITQNDAITDPKKRMHVMCLNILKAQDNGFVADLKPVDKVRVDDTAMIKKGTEGSWSEVHVVSEASGNTVTLTDGTTHRRNKVLSTAQQSSYQQHNLEKV
jgi:hypothetical protein